MIRIYDCSDNWTAPNHRPHSFGPKRNDVMADLEKYAAMFSFEYVARWHNADVIITNTTFPPDISRSKIPKVKRMDGIYWRDDEVHRNEMLNFAAASADLVIFISEYSQRAFHTLYPHIKLQDETVVLNGVNQNTFRVLQDKHGEYSTFTWAAACSNWARAEKRGFNLAQFAEILRGEGENLIVIGESAQHTTYCKFVEPVKHVTEYGYIADYDVLNRVLNKADAFVNFSFRDAGCKCVSQAVSVGLPVLYAASGGVPELVDGFGVGIEDWCGEPSFLDFTPMLKFDDIGKGYRRFKKNYYKFKKKKRDYLTDVVGEYFRNIVDIL